MLKKLVFTSALWRCACRSQPWAFGPGFSRIVRERQYRYVCQRSFWATVLDAKVTLSGPTGDKVLTTGSDGKALFQILTPGSYTSRSRKPD